MSRSVLAAALLHVALCASADGSESLNLALPTDNDALFHGGGAAFYQHVERNYQGEITTPWEGGQYGFVRDPMESPAGRVFTRFHEGIDIRPIHRDGRGEPTDEVRAIADGTVVYTNGVAGYSNYGKYVVIEHRWDGCSYYSLYGHLSEIAARVGQHVQRAEPIAVMGYTGEGLNQKRAHLHLELNLMLNRHFQAWYDRYMRSEPNRHGIYNGLNLAGLDIAGLYLALENDAGMTIPQFLRREEVFYSVLVPQSAHLELRRSQPWMVTGEGGNGWKISFTQGGLPIRIEPNERSTTQPTVSYARGSNIDLRHLTRGWLAGFGQNAALTDSGLAMIHLLTWPD